MLFRQFVNEDLGCASYLIGCEEAGEAVVVDPPYAIDELMDEAAFRDVRMIRTLETHTHADHVSGHGRLALEHGIPVSIHASAAVDYPNDPLVDEAEISVGNVTLRCLHTPGHRPEHCCFAVIDHTRADEPWLILTGDSLFVGDTARPDLAVAGVEGATDLHASLRRLLELADGVEVYPGHVAGSLCGRGMSAKGSTTIGFERRFNPMLAYSDAASFIAASAAVAAPKPPNLDRIVTVNRGPHLGAQPPVVETAAAQPSAQLLDVREVMSFLRGHLHRAFNVPVNGSSFATKAGFVLDATIPTQVVAATEAEARLAIRRLESVSIFAIAGYTLADSGPESSEPVSLDELRQLLTEDAVELIDVREPDEREDGDGQVARNVPYRLLATIDDLPSDRPLITICESGARAALAASILRARGFETRPVVAGGVRDL